MTNTNLMPLSGQLDSLLMERQSRPGAALRAALAEWAEATWARASAQGPASLTAAQIAAGLALAERPVFICGVHRSGTTLLRDLLDGHPQLCALPSEGTFLTNLKAKIAPLPEGERLRFLGEEWLRRLVNPINRPPYWLLGRVTDSDNPYVRYARLLRAWWPVVHEAFPDRSLAPLLTIALACDSVGGAGAQFWVEKTPTNEFFLEVLRREFPQARILHLVRNPIAIYASRKRLEERSFGDFRGERRMLREMARSFEIAASHLKAEHAAYYRVVRYEDLLRRPEEVTDEIAGFIGIAPHPCLRTPTVASIPVSANSSFLEQAPEGRLIADTTEGHDRSVTPREEERIAACVAESAGKCGYALKPISPARRLWLKGMTG